MSVHVFRIVLFHKKTHVTGNHLARLLRFRIIYKKIQKYILSNE